MRRLKCTDVQSNPTLSLQTKNIDTIGRQRSEEFGSEWLAQKITSSTKPCSQS